MPKLLHDILLETAETQPDSSALRLSEIACDYGDLVSHVGRAAGGLRQLGVDRNTRVATFLPNCTEAVITVFATSFLGGISVPINPLQRPRQVLHILQDSGAEILVTTNYLWDLISSSVESSKDLRSVIFTDSRSCDNSLMRTVNFFNWSDLTVAPAKIGGSKTAPGDPASLLYTSGSTGPAKGVVVSHSNLVSGAQIVSGYLGNRNTDRILAALPLSFDYGFSQVTTAFLVGAEAVLTNYSMPQTLLAELAEFEITALAGVPTMWTQLSSIRWADHLSQRMRYITNSGGRLPTTVLNHLKSKLPNTKIFLMYGLTEAFRSTYLDPEEVDNRPNSIGKAIPGVDINIVRRDGSLCGPGEPGELVHSGELVALGYWNNIEATAKRFHPLQSSSNLACDAANSVWSGDIVRSDLEGFLYFVERSDAMIKVSGYRISPSEIEEVVFSTELVRQVVAVGLEDRVLGQKIALAVIPSSPNSDIDFALRRICSLELPTYMQPGQIRFFEQLPSTPTGKPDRRAIAKLFDS